MASVKVLFEYEAEQEDELNLKVGDIVKNVDVQNGGWWEGEIGGKRGVFPENFVELIKSDENKAPPPTAAAAESKKQAKVTFQYEPEQDDELALEVGEIVEVLEDDDEGWWKGSLNGKIGMFPSNFVEKIKTSVVKEEQKPSLPEATEEADVKPRPKSHMGFGLSLEDLSRNKLKKVDKGGEQKPMQMVQPMDHAKEPEKKVPASPPVSAQPTTKPVQKAKVTFAYDPEQEDELKLDIGDVVIITNKNVFEGWMEGLLNGKKGLFPDNFVEMLPMENVKSEPGLPAPNNINGQKSVKRAAKQDPIAEPEKVHHTEKPKHMGIPLMPHGNNLKQELEKKMSQPPPASKPPLPETKKPASKGPAPPPPASKKPKPALPQQPKPPKPQVPAAPKKEEIHPSSPTKLVSEAPRSASISVGSVGNKFGPHPRSNSESFKRINPPAAAAPTKNQNGVTHQGSIDLDIIKSTEPLSHVQRAKAPTKNPPSKFKKAQETTEGTDKEDDMPIMENSRENNSKEVDQLKSQVNDIQNRMNEMEKKFKKLMLQVTDDLDNERKIRLNQQVEIDRLKKQLDILGEK